MTSRQACICALHISHIPFGDQNFWTNRTCLLFPKSVRKSACKTISWSCLREFPTVPVWTCCETVHWNWLQRTVSTVVILQSSLAYSGCLISRITLPRKHTCRVKNVSSNTNVLSKTCPLTQMSCQKRVLCHCICHFPFVATFWVFSF